MIRTSLPLPFGETFFADLPAGRALDFLVAGDGVDLLGDAFLPADFVALPLAAAGLPLGVCV